MSGAKPMVGILPGSFHQEKHFEAFRTDLLKNGYDSIVPNFPVANAEANLIDCADIAVRALRDHKDILLLAFSRGSSIALYAAGRLSASKIVLVGPALYPSTLTALGVSDKDLASLPPRSRPGYEERLVDLGDGLMEAPPDLARDTFYNQCTPAEQDEAVGLLIPQCRSIHTPPLEAWPDAPIEIILPAHDNTANPAYNELVINKVRSAGHSLVVNEIDSDHSPFVSARRLLAEMTLGIGDSYVS